MKFTVAVLIGAIALQMRGVLGENETWTPEKDCLTATLPNFFNLGECTKGYSDLCASDNDGAAGLVLKILQCFVTGMLNFDLSTQLYILSEFLKEALQEADPLTSILEDLCKDSPTFLQILLPCGIFELDEKVLCQGKLELQIPIALNVSQCLGAVPITCIEGEVLTEPLLKGITQFLACIIQTTVKLGAEGVANEILCYLTEIPELLLGTTITKVFGITAALVGAVQATFGIDCSMV